MYDASSRKDIRAAEKAARLAERDRIHYLQAAMSTWQGRAWFCDLLEFCHLFSDPFTADALKEAYLKGERNVGLRIFADIITHCPDDYIRMMRESNARRVEADTKRNRDAIDPATAERASSSDPDGGVEGSGEPSTDFDSYAGPDT